MRLLKYRRRTFTNQLVALAQNGVGVGGLCITLRVKPGCDACGIGARLARTQDATKGKFAVTF